MLLLQSRRKWRCWVNWRDARCGADARCQAQYTLESSSRELLRRNHCAATALLVFFARLQVLFCSAAHVKLCNWYPYHCLGPFEPRELLCQHLSLRSLCAARGQTRRSLMFIMRTQLERSAETAAAAVSGATNAAPGERPAWPLTPCPETAWLSFQGSGTLCSSSNPICWRQLQCRCQWQVNS